MSNSEPYVAGRRLRQGPGSPWQITISYSTDQLPEELVARMVTQLDAMSLSTIAHACTAALTIQAHRKVKRARVELNHLHACLAKQICPLVLAN